MRTIHTVNSDSHELTLLTWHFRLLACFVASHLLWHFRKPRHDFFGHLSLIALLIIMKSVLLALIISLILSAVLGSVEDDAVNVYGKPLESCSTPGMVSFCGVLISLFNFFSESLRGSHNFEILI